MVNIQKLKGRLREKDRTQAELARYLGISSATVNQKLNGTRPISLDEADKIASFLDIGEMDFRAYFFAPPSA